MGAPVISPLQISREAMIFETVSDRIDNSDMNGRKNVETGNSITVLLPRWAILSLDG